MEQSLSDTTRAFARKTMLPWDLTQSWARRARLFIHGQASRMDRQAGIIDAWWDSEDKDNVDVLKARLREDEVTRYE